KAEISEKDLAILKKTMHDFVFDILGLENENQSSMQQDKLDGTIALLIKMRNEARANRNFAMSDQIRDELLSLGIQLKDGKEGTTYHI
ncbi:hypothetical protein RZS08_09790, partial [Arthrospira platensis SPKY1]|nr:hypothetical protein [Arthrospira platensis SPKY1]